MANRLLRRKDVEERTGLPRSTLYYLMAKNAFPRQVRLSERAVAWDSEAVDAWIAERIKESEAA